MLKGKSQPRKKEKTNRKLEKSKRARRQHTEEKNEPKEGWHMRCIAEYEVSHKFSRTQLLLQS